jgi:hypothetical protein
VNKQRSQRSDIERFNLKKLNDVEVSNRCAALEDLGAEVETNRTSETSREE